MRYKSKQPKIEGEYKQYSHLRWQLLRAPWNEPEVSEKNETEYQCFHVMACDKNNCRIGVGRLQFNSDTEAQIRYMAVAKSHEREGIGKHIVSTLENNAIESNIDSMILDVREPAVEFYEKLGYMKKNNISTI